MVKASGSGADSVVETNKNCVVVYEDHVVKVRKGNRRSLRHGRREEAALRRLAGLPGVPAILDISADGRTLVMSRVPGRTLVERPDVPEASFIALRSLVEQMLERGVARHSLPRRDILVQDDGTVGLVDFERSTCRHFAADPVWLLARTVTRFNLLRILGQFAPRLLTPDEQRSLRRLTAIRAALQYPVRLKKWIKRRPPLETKSLAAGDRLPGWRPNSSD